MINQVKNLTSFFLWNISLNSASLAYTIMRFALSSESYRDEDTIKRKLCVFVCICGYKFPNNFPLSIPGGRLFICSCSHLLSGHSSGLLIMLEKNSY